MILPLVRQIAAVPCECAECVRANVQRPSVEYRPTKLHAARWLHGVELRDWWASKDRADRDRRVFFEGLRARVNRMAGR